MIKRIAGSVFAICLLMGLGCQPKKKGSFSVAGTFRNMDKLSAVEGPISKVYLIEVVYGRNNAPIVLDSAKLPAGSGSFNLSGMTASEGLYELVFGNGAVTVPLINDAAEIRVDLDMSKPEEFYDVKGSVGSSQLKELITRFGRVNYRVEESMAVLDSLKAANAPDSLLLAATGKKNSAIQELNTYLKQFFNTSNSGTTAGVALGWASRTLPKSEFEATLSDLLRRFPDNNVLTNLKKDYDRQVAQMAEQQKNKWVGQQAPDLALPDPNGKTVSIASFKGKYLLVDFWASWCGPCREENPNVVKVHNEFKNRNFAILGVSLDKERDAWLQAILTDQLDWTHVSDLKYWQSKAVETFSFESIPYNVLIDPEGKVIAEGLRGAALENKLKEVLTN